MEKKIIIKLNEAVNLINNDGQKKAYKSDSLNRIQNYLDFIYPQKYLVVENSYEFKNNEIFQKENLDFKKLDKIMEEYINLRLNGKHHKAYLLQDFIFIQTMKSFYGDDFFDKMETK